MSVHLSLHRHRPSSRSRLSAAFILVGLLALVFAASSNAKTIRKSALTNIKFSLTRAADGTITAEGTYTSPNPHCLDARRWKKLNNGEYDNPPGFGLYYGGHASAWAGSLAPISPFGRSPLLWKAVWPGSRTVHGEVGLKSESQPFQYFTSTVSAAIGPVGGGVAVAFRIIYKRGKDKIELNCPGVIKEIRPPYAPSVLPNPLPGPTNAPVTAPALARS